VLVEMAFISNDKDREALTDRFLQRQFAVAITKGIGDYIEAEKMPGMVRERSAAYGVA
jgi:N-acetylmuramoyl-L-alanine amidase